MSGMAARGLLIRKFSDRMQGVSLWEHAFGKSVP